MSEPKYMAVPPRAWRSLLVAAYKAKQLSWGKVFAELFAAGWRGPMDRDGFPTRR